MTGTGHISQAPVAMVLSSLACRDWMHGDWFSTQFLTDDHYRLSRTTLRFIGTNSSSVVVSWPVLPYLSGIFKDPIRPLPQVMMLSTPSTEMPGHCKCTLYNTLAALSDTDFNPFQVG